jgi:hypothetical protein
MDMSYVIADPELMTSAASDLATIGSNVNAAHMVAAARTLAVIPAAADEVSTGIAHLFSQHAQDHQALAGQASAFHQEFVHHLTAGATSYSSAEAFIASLLHDLNVSVNSFNDALATIHNQIISQIDSALSVILLPFWVLFLVSFALFVYLSIWVF